MCSPAEFVFCPVCFGLGFLFHFVGEGILCCLFSIGKVIFRKFRS